MADLTACRASSIRGKGKESRIVMSIQSSEVDTQAYLSRLLMNMITTCDAYGLRDGRIIPCLSQVSRHLHTSVCNCTGIVLMWQVNRFHCHHRNSMLEAVTET